MAIEGGHGGDIVSTSATGRKMNKTPNIVTKPKATIDATIAVHLRRIIVSQGVTSSPTAMPSNNQAQRQRQAGVAFANAKGMTA
jgi:hypothetical protein